jgi:23S rRNA (adenine2503-C2)-methyltransferase
MPASPPIRPIIFGETLESLTTRLAEMGQPAYRARQILEWLYKKRVGRWPEMTNLPASLRAWLEETFDLEPARLMLAKDSSDVTDKLLLELRDHSLIETVIIRAPQEGVGVDHSRKTICVSTQVGCAYGCRFCASGLAGWKRDLSAGEIVAQLMEVCRREDTITPRARAELASFDNIVVMGMGEPLANYDALLHALGILNAPWGLGFGARRVTISTSGLVPQIRRLADEKLGFRLAISLHGATNEVREQIMPVNRRYPLEELLPAAKYFSDRHGRMITLEFILIAEVNDSPDQATRLAAIARDLHAHVNLIPYNTVEGLDWQRPSVARQDEFADTLRDGGVSVTIRREKGHDIAAACGQLRLKVERDGQIEPAPLKGTRPAA